MHFFKLTVRTRVLLLKLMGLKRQRMDIILSQLNSVHNLKVASFKSI
jgi:hypothetical protein